MTPSSPRYTGPERRTGDKRRKKIRYRFIDKRTGFDRRRRYLVLGTVRDNPWMLVVVLVALNLASLLDGFLTAVEVALGLANEGNPVLVRLFEIHPYAATVFKVGVIAFVSVSIWRSRRYRVMLLLALTALTLYTALLAYHLGSINGIMGG